MGEASGRICKEINQDHRFEDRAVSNIKVGYLSSIFPGTTRDTPAARPGSMAQRVQELLDEIGGVATELAPLEGYGSALKR